MKNVSHADNEKKNLWRHFKILFLQLGIEKVNYPSLP